SIVKIKDSDLQILADRDVKERAQEFVLQYRTQIERYIDLHPEFLGALLPLPQDDHALPIIREMLAAGSCAGVGPMAAVAGVIAQYVASGLLREGCREVMVENGGDIYLKRNRQCTVALFAGKSPLSLQVGVKIAETRMPVAVCTSSGTVGHSLSFGLADSVTVIGKSAAVADAAATRLGNEVGRSNKAEKGIRQALEVGRTIRGVDGIVVIRADKIGAAGDVELVKLVP
ncbi:MAG: UPF0280 family protein, partial [Desulforhopalus sp.]